jgi:hypothetical protein
MKKILFIFMLLLLSCSTTKEVCEKETKKCCKIK